jgi:hypothetical protein
MFLIWGKQFNLFERWFYQDNIKYKYIFIFRNMGDSDESDFEVNSDDSFEEDDDYDRK